jgi:hypothetical protein
MSTNKKKARKIARFQLFAPLHQPAGFVRISLQSPCPEPYLQLSKDLSRVGCHAAGDFCPARLRRLRQASRSVEDLVGGSSVCLIWRCTLRTASIGVPTTKFSATNDELTHEYVLTLTLVS